MLFWRWRLVFVQNHLHIYTQDYKVKCYLVCKTDVGIETIAKNIRFRRIPKEVLSHTIIV